MAAAAAVSCLNADLRPSFSGGPITDDVSIPAASCPLRPGTRVSTRWGSLCEILVLDVTINRFMPAVIISVIFAYAVSTLAPLIKVQPVVQNRERSRGQSAVVDGFYFEVRDDDSMIRFTKWRVKNRGHSARGVRHHEVQNILTSCGLGHMLFEAMKVVHVLCSLPGSRGGSAAAEPFLAVDIEVPSNNNMPAFEAG